MELLPLALTSGWTSGINVYATVLILGLLGRFAGIDEVPGGLQRTDVLIASAVLTAIQLVADKVPYVDSIWDRASTVVRPIAGAVIGASLAGDVSVAGVTAVAVLNPVAAAVIVAVLLVAGIWLTVAVLDRVRRGWRAFRRWMQPA